MFRPHHIVVGHLLTRDKTQECTWEVHSHLYVYWKNHVRRRFIQSWHKDYQESINGTSFPNVRLSWNIAEWNVYPCLIIYLQNSTIYCTVFSFPYDPSEIWKMLLDQIARREARRAGSKRKGQRVLENVYFKSDLFFTIVKIQLIDDFERGHLSAMNNQQELHYLKF